MTAFTARALSTNRLQEVVTKNGHGFVVGDVVSFDGTDWELSVASSILLSRGSCMVSLVLDVNTFVVTQVGHVVNITDLSIAPLNVNVQYYLDPVLPGFLTNTRPSSVGQVILPCAIADTPNSVYFFGGTGELITSPTEFAWNVVAVDTTMVANNGYFINSAGNVNMTLPQTFAEGDVMSLILVNTGTFTILQRNAPIQQQILTLGGETTLGGGGQILSVDLHMRVDLIGYVADTSLHCDSNGSINVT